MSTIYSRQRPLIKCNDTQFFSMTLLIFRPKEIGTAFGLTRRELFFLKELPYDWVQYASSTYFLLRYRKRYVSVHCRGQNPTESTRYESISLWSRIMNFVTNHKTYSRIAYPGRDITSEYRYGCPGWNIVPKLLVDDLIISYIGITFMVQTFTKPELQILFRDFPLHCTHCSYRHQKLPQDNPGAIWTTTLYQKVTLR